MIAATVCADGPLPPEAALSAWRLADPQLRIELIAAEPHVRDPVAMAFDEDGRIYVVEMNDYPLGPAGGHVKLLETDANGHVVRSNVFADHLSFPSGVCVWKGGLFVTAAPDLLYLKDTDGDGRADVREVVYTGFATGNQQHRVNNPTFAFDSWIYGGNGHSGGLIRRVIRGEKTGRAVNIAGMDWRFRPDLTEFEAVAGQSQFAQTFDAWGNRFLNENWAHIRHAVLSSRYLRRNPHLPPPAPFEEIAEHGATAPVFPASKILPRFNEPHMAGAFTSACAVTIYLGDALPSRYRGAAFVCEPVHNLVHLDLLEPRGATFTARRAWPDREFLASSDPLCRPVNLCVGPDGALYVIDYYRAVIEHPEWIHNRKDSQLTADEIRQIDFRAGDDRGRIWRVAPRNFRPPPKPRLSQSSTRELTTHLSHANGWWRLTAQRLLLERQDPTAIAPLRAIARSSREPLARFHALYTLDNLGALDAETLQRALRNAHARVREHALRLCESRHADILFSAALRLADDPDFRVRWQLALSLGQVLPSRGVPSEISRVFAKIALRDSADPWMRFAVLSAAEPLPLLEELLKDESFHIQDRSPEWFRPLATLIGARKNAHEVNTLLMRIADSSPVRWQVEALGGLAEGLRHSRARLEDFSMSERMAEHFRYAERTAAAADQPEPIRVAAVRLLALAPWDAVSQTLSELISPQQPQALQLAAIEAVAANGGRTAADLLLSRWHGFSPSARAATLDAILARADQARAVLDALEHGAIRASDLDAARRDRLLRHPLRAVAERAQKLLAADTRSSRADALETFRPALTLRGDAQRGQAIYERLCAQCHRLADHGQAVGPDFAGLRGRSRQQLLVDILDPNRAVEPKFLSYTLEIKGGETLMGIVAAETETSLTLRAADGKDRTVLRSEIETLTAGSLSLMPEGLEQGLTLQDLADLLAVFSSSARLMTTPDAGGTVRLRASESEIYGSSLVLEEKHQNLGSWQSCDDHAVWTIQLPKKQRFAVEIHYSCAEDAAGNDFVIEMGDRQLTGKIASTGTWDDYRSIVVGAVELPAGRTVVRIRPRNRLRGTLMDLKEILLNPIKKSGAAAQSILSQ